MGGAGREREGEREIAGTGREERKVGSARSPVCVSMCRVVVVVGLGGSRADFYG